MTIKTNQKRKTLKAFFLFLSLMCLSSASFSMEESKDGYEDDVAPRVIYRNGAPEIGPQRYLVVRPSRKFSVVSPAEHFMKGLVEGPHKTITVPFFYGVVNATLPDNKGRRLHSGNNPYLHLLKTLASLTDASEQSSFFGRVRNLLGNTRGLETKERTLFVAACFQIASLVPILFDLEAQSSMSHEQIKKCVLATAQLLVCAPKISHLINGNTAHPPLLSVESSPEVDLVEAGEKLFRQKGGFLFEPQYNGEARVDISKRRYALCSDKNLHDLLSVINNDSFADASGEDIMRQLNGVVSKGDSGYYWVVEKQIKEDTEEMQRQQEEIRSMYFENIRAQKERTRRIETERREAQERRRQELLDMNYAIRVQGQINQQQAPRLTRVSAGAGGPPL